MENEKYIRALKNLEPSARSLTPREFTILSYHVGATDGNAHTLQETGDVFKITREAVRLNTNKSMEKMKNIDSKLDK